MSENQQNYLRFGRATEIENKRDRKLYRFLEMLPGVLTWLTFALMILGAKFFPWPTSIFLIAFTIFWFLRTIYLALHLRSGFLELRQNEKTDWKKELNGLSLPNQTLPQIKSWHEIIHLIILPTLHESPEIIETTLNGLINSGYDPQKMIVILAMDFRSDEALKERQTTAQIIKKKFQGKFLELEATFHPFGIPGEVAGKGSNEKFAVNEAVEKIIKPQKIEFEKIIVSCFDVDTVIGKNFFERLTHKYLTCKKPLRSSFQPVPVFLNNIWESPSLSRIFAFSTTFWQLIQQARPKILVTFSSQSIGLKPLYELGYWQENVVSEDSRIFYQALLHFDGDWQTEPLNFPIYMDANLAETFWQTLKNIYKQQKRWAYGAENIPYLLFGFFKNKKISNEIKWRFGFNIIEGFHSWNTHSLIILTQGWILLWLGGKDFAFSILSFNLPQILGTLMRASMYGIFISMYLTILMLPKSEKKLPWINYLVVCLQWFLSPLAIIFSTIPAIEASSRLMLGKYMGFWSTPKIRIGNK